MDLGTKSKEWEFEKVIISFFRSPALSNDESLVKVMTEEDDQGCETSHTICMLWEIVSQGGFAREHGVLEKSWE